ncbi:MAG: hypothetical protein HC802_05280 [Caldilineaceae bacterium]|nr:hypothetical protein [Caldilineaceae bacterium]
MMKHARSRLPALHQIWAGLALLGLLALSMAFWPSIGLAAPLSQAEPSPPQTVELGQFVFRDLQIGASAEFQIEAPASTNYLLTTDNEEEALAFDLVVTGPNGDELVNGIFETTELALESGLYTFEFLAVDTANLSFVLLGELGAMTADADQPGVLRSGSIYNETDVSEARYADLSIPATDYPRQILLFIEPGPEDRFFLSAQGNDAVAKTISTDDASLLSLWTQGGDYRITVEPAERRSRFTLIVFLSGPPTPLTLGESIEGAIPVGSSQTVYQLELTEDLTELRLLLDSDTAGLTITMVDQLSGGAFAASSSGAPTLALENVPAGLYYVFVETDLAVTEDIPFTLSADGLTGEPLPFLENGVPTTGAFAEGEESAAYRFEVTLPGTLVQLAAQSESEAANFDISVGMQPEQEIWRSYKLGAEDSLEFVAPYAGLYYVTVLSNGSPGSFTIAAAEAGGAPSVNLNGATWGSVEAGGTDVHLLPIDGSGQLLSVLLAGAPGTDLGLGIAAYDSRGEQVAYAFDPGGGSTAIVSKRIESPGLYEVSVSALPGVGGDYLLLTRLEQPAELLGEQWANSATASSQRSESEGSAQQATGKPDTRVAGDAATAWSQATLIAASSPLT